MRIEISADDVFTLGERRTTIRIGNATIETPTPAVTTSDLNRASNITKKFGIDIFYPNTVFENQDIIYRAHVKKRILDEDGRGKHSDTVNSNISGANSFSNSVLSYYVPYLDKRIEITKGLVESLIKMQLDTELDFVTILDSVRIAPDVMKDIVSEQAKNIRDNGKEPLYMIRLDMDEEFFSARILDAKEKVSGVIGMYSDYRYSYKNYNFMSELRSDNGLVRLFSGLEKMYPKNGSGGFYPLGFLVSDIYSPVAGKPGKGKAKKNSDLNKLKRKKRIVNERRIARRFDDKTGGYLSIPLHKHIHGPILDCACPICDNSMMDDLLAEYEGNLTQAFKIHDVYGIFNFARRSSGLFHNGTLLGDLKSRNYTESVLKETFLSSESRRQMTL